MAAKTPDLRVGAKVEFPVGQPRDLCVVTYNIHRCVGRDGVTDPSRVVEVLQEIKPDIAGLQEVSVDPKGGPKDRQLDYLRDATGLTSTFAPTRNLGTTLYGNGLLTSGVLRDNQHHDLSVSGREPRAAIDARIDLGGREIAVLVTHIGLDPKERRKQVGQLSNLLSDSPFLILMGDFNEWRPRAKYLKPLDDRLGRLFSVPRTFPTRLPLLPLDRIWVRPPAALLDLRVHRSATARVASDHLPLVARIGFP